MSRFHFPDGALCAVDCVVTFILLTQAVFEPLTFSIVSARLYLFPLLLSSVILEHFLFKIRPLEWIIISLLEQFIFVLLD